MTQSDVPGRQRIVTLVKWGRREFSKYVSLPLVHEIKTKSEKQKKVKL